MKLVLVSFAALIVLASALDAPSSPTTAPNKDLAEIFMKKTLQSSEFLPVLNAFEFQFLVPKAQERKFGVFLLFTSTSSTCRACHIVGSQFNIVAKNFREQFPNEKSVFFARVYAEKAQDLAKALDLQGLPVVAYLPPIRRGQEGEYSKKVFDFSRHNAWTAFGIGSFVYDETQFEISDLPKPSLSEVEGDTGAGSRIMLFLLAIAIVAMSYFYFRDHPQKLRFLTHPMVLFAGCIVVWYLMISGFTYNTINSPPWVMADPQTKGPRFFHPSSHSQLGMEGYIMGTMETGFALVFLGLNEFLPRILKPNHQNHLNISLFFITASFFLIRAIAGIYRFKNPGYMF